MMETISSLQSDFNAVLATPNCEICKKVLSGIMKYNVSKSSEARAAVADLFYATLKMIQALDDSNAINELHNNIIDAFDNINQIAKDGKESSSLVIVDFLNELFQKRKDINTIIKLNNDDLPVLLSDLEPIKFIFTLVDQEGNRYFPVNELLGNIIQDDRFINTKIEPYHVNLIQLAVEMYGAINGEDVRTKFKDLITKCNLQFINYLDGSCSRLDTSDMCNYRNNKVMIFYDSSHQKVLIRHEDEKYFSPLVESTELKYEYNSYGKTIGSFVEMDINGVPIDYSDALKDNPKEFLRLIYDKGCRNILIEKMIVRKADGHYEPINPYCVNDKRVIKGKLKCRDGKVCFTNEFLDCISEGRLKMFSMDGNHSPLDIISLGLCISLLDYEPMNIDLLFGGSKNDWLQNEVVHNWINNSKNKVDALEYVLSKIANDLDYCRSDKTLRELKFSKSKIRDTLPFYVKLDWVYDLLQLPNYPCVYAGSINDSDDDDEEYLIDFSPVSNKTLAKIQHDEITSISSKNITLIGETEKEDFYKREVCYLIFKDDIWIGSAELQNVLKVLVNIELLNQRLLDYKLADTIREDMYCELESRSKLHKDELKDIEIKPLEFESLFKVRLVNNLVLNKIDNVRWQYYFDLFIKCQKLSFEDIIHDIHFSEKTDGVLYVPKDRFEEDAALRKIYEKYIRKHADRDRNWWYSYDLFKKNEEVYESGHKISVIRFLFDNTELGTATTRALAANLGFENEWISFMMDRSNKNEENLRSQIDVQKKKCQKYAIGSELLSLKQIYAMNHPRIEACSYYGTNEGDQTISDFLEYCGIDHCNFSVFHNRDIIPKSELVYSDCKELGIDFKKGIYMVIREFNMTKLSILPKGAVGAAGNVVTLFDKKDENNIIPDYL